MPVRYGQVLNDNITISGIDKNFTLLGGARFETPFSSTAGYGDDCFRVMRRETSVNARTQWLTSGYSPLLRECGAQRVRVDVKGKAEPLYGVLYLADVFSSSTGPGARSYAINVPSARIEQAYAGGSSAAYETVNFQIFMEDGSTYPGLTFSWVLWLSSTPF